MYLSRYYSSQIFIPDSSSLFLFACALSHLRIPFLFFFFLPLSLLNKGLHLAELLSRCAYFLIVIMLTYPPLGL
jgi:hypothetical protein